jgi:hypothetical protein
MRDYICPEKGDSFQVLIDKADKYDKEVIGVELYLDGERIRGKKTFPSRCRYFGFKEGNGDYREFIF